jgi:type III restriction enzyme
MSKLKIQFEADQLHQVGAIQSTVKLFQGFTKKQDGSWIGDDTKPNLDPYEMLDEGWLFDNLLINQRDNGLIEDMYLNFEDGFELSGNNSWRFPYYTIEMETGTGKTYVYLRSILELRKHYGWTKFIIIVPSVAIYEGVIKTFAITREHFKTLYGNETVNLIEYSGQHLGKLRNFSISSTVEILLMTIDSFNKESNVFYKPTEKLQGEKLPYQYVQETRPILILDESQNYNSEGSKMALRTLHPLFALKYSATPTEKGRTREENRELMNRIYLLSPVHAFQQNLVKKIEVLGITEQFNLNDNQISFVFKDSKKGYGPEVEARLNVLKGGTLTQETLRLKKVTISMREQKTKTTKDLRSRRSTKVLMSSSLQMRNR